MVIVVTCQTSLELAFVGELLDSIRAKFVSLTTGCATDAARSAALARSFDSAARPRGRFFFRLFFFADAPPLSDSGEWPCVVFGVSLSL